MSSRSFKSRILSVQTRNRTVCSQTCRIYSIKCLSYSQGRLSLHCWQLKLNVMETLTTFGRWKLVPIKTGRHKNWSHKNCALSRNCNSPRFILMMHLAQTCMRPALKIVVTIKSGRLFLDDRFLRFQVHQSSSLVGSSISVHRCNGTRAPRLARSFVCLFHGSGWKRKVEIINRLVNICQTTCNGRKGSGFAFSGRCTLQTTQAGANDWHFVLFYKTGLP